jgi:hypothetical protein
MKAGMSKSFNRTTRSTVNNKSNYGTLYSSNNNHNIVDSNNSKRSLKNQQVTSPLNYNYNYSVKSTSNEKMYSNSPQQTYYNNTTNYGHLRELPDIEVYERGDRSLLGPRIITLNNLRVK